MTYIDSFCKGLTTRLKEDLPGDKVRKMMSPSARFVEGFEGNHKGKPRESAVLILLCHQKTAEGREEKDGNNTEGNRAVGNSTVSNNTVDNNTVSNNYKRLNLIMPLIKRVNNGTHHSGQVSFPGGGKESRDKDIIHTALREGNEEIGVDTDKIRVLGTLSDIYIPVSNYNVTPVVGYIEELPEFKAQKSEVDYVIAASLPELFYEKNKGRENIERHNMLIEAPYYMCGKDKIWGATAMILREFEALYGEVINKL